MGGVPIATKTVYTGLGAPGEHVQSNKSCVEVTAIVEITAISSGTLVGSQPR